MQLRTKLYACSKWVYLVIWSCIKLWAELNLGLYCLWPFIWIMQICFPINLCVVTWLKMFLLYHIILLYHTILFRDYVSGEKLFEELRESLKRKTVLLIWRINRCCDDIDKLPTPTRITPSWISLIIDNYHPDNTHTGQL